jgi:cephalosporin hydroxylase
MKITIDTDARQLTVTEASSSRSIDLYSREAFEIISRSWVQVGWNQKYSYTFTWFGRPFLQLPEDALRIQEVIWRIQPDVIIETGVAHGGSLVFYASLCKAMERGRVIGIDIEIRPHNRAAIEAHPLAQLITLIEGSSTAPQTIEKVRSLIPPNARVLVILDSCHTYQHVADELEAYCGFVSSGSYIVATDGIMRDLTNVPRGQKDWATDNPSNAAEDFARRHVEFALEQPPWLFNESDLKHNITYWPSAFLRRR